MLLKLCTLEPPSLTSITDCRSLSASLPDASAVPSVESAPRETELSVALPPFAQDQGSETLDIRPDESEVQILEVTDSQNSVDGLDRDPRLEALGWYMDEEKGKPKVSVTGGNQGNGAKAEISEIELKLTVDQISGEKLFVSAITEHTNAVAAGGSGGCGARCTVALSFGCFTKFRAD